MKNGFDFEVEAVVVVAQLIIPLLILIDLVLLSIL